MKKLYLLFFLFLSCNLLLAQTTETFETETPGSTTFTDNGKTFIITSQAQGPFDIQGNYPGTGWNGTSADNRYIDNDGFAAFNMPVQFTISTSDASAITLKSMYLFLSTNALNLNVSGSVTITGKLAGVTKFTASANAPFNTSMAVNNGFTFIDMSTYGGQNNSSTLIDQFVVLTSGNISYVSLDALRWQGSTCPTINSTGTQTNVSCNGGANGSATVVPSGGTAPYTYSWSPSGGTGATITGRSAGNYIVTITDANGCTGTRTFTITQPAAPVSGTTVVTNVACNGGNTGAINLTPTGGTGPYTFNWGGGITTEDRTSLSAGNYSVVITDANGCTGTVNVTVNQPASAISGSTVVTNVACNGGTTGAINLTPFGGTGPYTFNWGGGITTEDRTGLSAGNYSVVITDANGCTGTVNVTVNQPASAISGSTVVTNVACNGGTTGAINLTPTGGTGPYTFNWGGGITTEDRTGLAAGNYSVVITDANGCTGTVNATVIQPASAISGTTVVTNVACNGGTTGAINLTPTGGTGPYTFNWGGGITTEDRTGLAAGNYSVVITDANGCTGTVNATVTQPASAISGSTVVTNVACNGGTTGAINLTPTGGTGPYTFNWGGGITTEDRTGLAAGNYSVVITDANGCTGTVNVTVNQPASAISGSTVVTNVACNGGTTGAINLTPFGGTGPYTFNWGGGITTEDRTGLSAGNYSVVITDANGCTGTVNVTVNQPASAISGSTVVTNVACNGGTTGAINLTPFGGTGPYTFNWGGGITTEDRTGLAAGNYSVVITDANGCTGTVNATVTQPASAISGTTVVTNVACNGGTTGAINLTPTGGTGPYTFNWGGGITTEDRTGLAAGNYSVVITDANGCTGTVNVTVTQPASAISGTTVVTNVACNGGTTGAINLTPTGGTGPYTFNWGGGITTEDRTGLSAGNYSVVITDANGCTGTVNVTVTQPASAISGSTVVTNVACNGGTTGAINLTPTGGTGPYTFNWGGGITTEDRTGLAAGNYSVVITDANGCTGTVNVTVNQPASAISGSTVVTNVACNGGTTGAINLTPFGGTGPYTFNWGGGITTEDRTGLSAGNYSVVITDANGCTGTVNITVTQPASAISGSTVVTNIACNGGTTGAINLTPTGGTGPYTFNWGGGITTEDRTGLSAGNYSVVITDANGCTGTVNATVNQPASAISGSTVVTNVACNGGTTGAINLTPTGGTGPYTFNWGGGITTEDRTGLSAGNYSVVITDANGCTGTVNATVTQPASAISGSTVVTNVACNGGTTGAINLTPTGGTGPYTFNWGGGITTEDRTGLSAGNYSVVITDANGCTGTVNATVNQPASAISGSTVVTNVACNGGTTGAINLTPFGGTGPYTFNWGSGITTEDRTGLSAGNYSVVITDANGCTGTVNATVTQPSALVASASAQTNVSCNGGSNGSATVAVTGGTGAYTYSWAPSGGTAATATGLAAGTYTVTVTDANGCTTTQSFTLTQPSALVASASAQTNVSCNGGANGSATVAVTGGTGAYTYSWAPSGGTGATATGLAAGTYTVTVTDANGCTATQSFTITQPAALVASASAQTNVSCNGGSNGSATVAVTGGTGAYTYSWAPSGGTGATATGLSAGTYTVTVTDANGCTDTESFIITQPSALVASASAQANVSCNGGSNGSATVAVTGGTGAYTYSWAPSGGTAATATGLAAGTYTVTVTDANGCTATQSFTITQPSTLVASASSQTNVSCNGGSNGSATVAVTGGTGAYTYLWAPSGGTAATATGLAAGTYTVTVTDANGCTATQSFTITQPSALVASALAQTNVSCNGGSNGSATVAVTGGTGAYTYSWAPSGGTGATATSLAAGTYTVTVTDANGCTATQSFTITQPSALVASASAQTNVSCNGGSNGSATVAVTGGTGAYTYSWAPSGGTAATATGLAAGTYTVTVTDANGCTATQSFTIAQPSALVATMTSTNVTCPGASDGTATATVTGGTGAYTYSWAPSGGTGATATGLSAGTYTVTVTDANGCTVTESIEVITTPDTTAPVTDVANLPAISNYCSVLSDEIAIPTATDNCNGTITATTTDVLEYTSEGSYTITWSYDDGNGNIATQTQTINVLASPLDQVTFDDATFVYNTSVQTIEVENLPAGATVEYSITPATGTDNGAVNAGVYTVTATVTPPAEAFNCDPVTLTATLTIDRAPQVIVFDPIPVKNLETDPDFQLDATATSGLPVYYTYTYTTPQPPATVTPEGFVDMLTSGEVLITAHQDGNENYLPADNVTQLLVIESSNASIVTITVGGQAYDTPSGEIYHLIECADSSETVDVTIVTEANATVVPGHQFTIDTPVPGIYTQEVTVTSQDGTIINTYTVVVEKRFDFFDIVEQKFDNVLLVNNNPATNGGYEFVAYQWYRNNQLIGTGQYYSAGENITDLLNPDADYYVRMTTVDGEVLQTCVAQIELEHDFAARLYPNPAVAGRFITIDANFPQHELDQMQLSLYSLTGSLVTTVKSSSRVTEIQLPAAIEDGTYIVVIETPKINKTLKVIVRK